MGTTGSWRTYAIARRVFRRPLAGRSALRRGLRAGAGDGRLIAFLHENTRVLEQTYGDTNVQMRVRMDPALAGVIRNMGGRVEPAPAASAGPEVQ